MYIVLAHKKGEVQQCSHTYLIQGQGLSTAADDHIPRTHLDLVLNKPQQVLLVHAGGSVHVSVHLRGREGEWRGERERGEGGMGGGLEMGVGSTLTHMDLLYLSHVVEVTMRYQFLSLQFLVLVEHLVQSESRLEVVEPPECEWLPVDWGGEVDQVNRKCTSHHTRLHIPHLYSWYRGHRLLTSTYMYFSYICNMYNACTDLDAYEHSLYTSGHNYIDPPKIRTHSHRSI